MSFTHVDPGYLESIKAKTPLAELRRATLLMAVVPVLIFAVVVALARGGEAGSWAVGLPLAVGVGAYLVLRARGFPVAPLPLSTEAGPAGRQSVAALRTSVLTRLTITEVPLLVGLTVALVVGSLLPYVAAFVVGWPQLVLQAMPTRRHIEKLRAHLESKGADSQIWPALLEPLD